MPIDRDVALAAEPTVRELRWSDQDVLLYHLSLGAGVADLRWVYERDLRVLPTFALVAGTRSAGGGSAQPMRLSGIDVDLRRILHGGQAVTLHAPIPAAGRALATSRVADVLDKGKAAVIVTETAVADLAGTPLWTATSQIWARGEGGFDGGRPAVPSSPPPRPPSSPPAVPEREPDLVLESPTSDRAAALYRLNGDRNPLHIDPDFAQAAGFERPILHGLASFGIVCKAVVDALLDGDPTRVRDYSARFAGIMLPGETLRTRIWQDGERVLLQASCADRNDAPVLTHATLGHA